MGRDFRPCRFKSMNEGSLEGQEDAIPFRIFFAVYFDFAVDEAHDAVAKLLVDNGLPGAHGQRTRKGSARRHAP